MGRSLTSIPAMFHSLSNLTSYPRLLFRKQQETTSFSLGNKDDRLQQQNGNFIYLLIETK